VGTWLFREWPGRPAAALVLLCGCGAELQAEMQAESQELAGGLLASVPFSLALHIRRRAARVTDSALGVGRPLCVTAGRVRVTPS
jgi:hypothetical protein